VHENENEGENMRKVEETKCWMCEGRGYIGDETECPVCHPNINLPEPEEVTA